MKVICIDNKMKYHNNEYYYLTIGKTYEGFPIDIDIDPYIRNGKETKFYFICDNSNTSNLYPIDRFITLQEYRNNKINEILNE
jgi:hypothetical protein